MEWRKPILQIIKRGHSTKIYEEPKIFEKSSEMTANPCRYRRNARQIHGKEVRLPINSVAQGSISLQCSV